MLRFYFLTIFSLVLAGCATPSQKFASYAQELGLLMDATQTQQFEHRLFINQSALQGSRGEELHVYIDGDGTPWTIDSRIASDPTSRNPLILKLLTQDKTPSILLGRPCYHQAEVAPDCPAKYWTSHRYSTEVVDSLVAGLKKWLSSKSYKKVVLIGFSGGGTLAVLMAQNLPSVTTIVTIGANLDVAAWSNHHGYLPLGQSLNPAELALNIRARQFHLVGSNDKVVPPVTLKKFIAKNDKALLIQYPNFEHHCCWADNWSDILTAVFNHE